MMNNTDVMVRRGLSDLSIRNLFVVPTIVFLILINIFPLLYSLILSFADYSAVSGNLRNGSVCETTGNCFMIRMCGKASISR